MPVIAGCGSGSETDSAEPEAADSAPSRPDLCALLTASEIEEALGQAPGAAEPGDEDLGQCTWSSADGSGTSVSLTLDEASLDSFDQFVFDFGEEFGGENPPPEEYHPVDGVSGDWAMYVTEEHLVRAFRGDHELHVRAPGAEEAQVIDLAAKAMQRLP